MEVSEKEVQKLLDKITTINSKKVVTVDDLLEYASFEKQEQITSCIKVLKDSGFVRVSSITNHGRFETQIIPEGGIEYECGAKKERSEIASKKTKTTRKHSH